MVRAHVLYSGRVQGVYFRATAERIAQGLAVTGWVRNLPDGRVELVAEGARNVVQALLDGIAQAKRDNITDAACDWTPATGEFTEFAIRR